MIDIIHDLLANLRFVSAISFVWLATAWVTRSETTFPAKIGVTAHTTFAFAPLITISAYGMIPEVLVSTIHGGFALMHGMIIFFTWKQKRNRKKS